MIHLAADKHHFKYSSSLLYQVLNRTLHFTSAAVTVARLDTNSLAVTSQSHANNQWWLRCFGKTSLSSKCVNQTLLQ